MVHKLNNIYIANLAFGNNIVQKIIFANSIEIAIDTISDYYDEVLIIAIISLQDVLDLLDKIQKNESIFVLEMKPNEVLLPTLTVTIMEDKTLEQVLKESNDKEAIIYSKESLAALLINIINQINEKSSQPLIAESYLI